MHPCKNCLVRPCCQVSCEKKESYVSKWSSTIVPLAIIISGIGLGSLLMYCSLEKEAGRADYSFQLLLLWIISVVYNLIINKFVDEDPPGQIANILFAPMIAAALSIIFITAKYINRYG